PGAKMSRQVPQLENDARWSLICVAPAVIAAGTSAGEKLHALELLLPAAIAAVTPALIEVATALFMVVLTPAPPRLMFATAGLMWLLVTQLMPATICEVVPLPLQFSTRTAKMRAPLATPKELPAAVPATWVPWPLQSFAEPPGVTASKPVKARPPKSL